MNKWSWLVIIVCASLVLPISAHGGVLDALPNDAVLQRAYQIHQMRHTNVSIEMEASDSTALLNALRAAPIVTVARSNANNWEVWQGYTWQPFETQYSHTLVFEDYRVWLAPAPGGTLVAVSLPKSLGRNGRDWHCASEFVIENTDALLAVILGG